ncbi:hypothetical protein BURMUCGD1_4001 [Burkholderia multivorans CGD1]|nr:hypothetical protein BURMUCGD1_4001 [Burkholderia multivorans CGD1]
MLSAASIRGAQIMPSIAVARIDEFPCRPIVSINCMRREMSA